MKLSGSIESITWSRVPKIRGRKSKIRALGCPGNDTSRSTPSEVSISEFYFPTLDR